jgi:hypothetical protein
MVFGCAWNPWEAHNTQADEARHVSHNSSSFITYGKKHLNVWEYAEHKLVRVPASATDTAEVAVPGAISCDGVRRFRTAAAAKEEEEAAAHDADDEVGQNTASYAVHVRQGQGLIVRRTDQRRGWGAPLYFRVLVRPTLIADGRSPKLAVYGDTNVLSKDVLCAWCAHIYVVPVPRLCMRCAMVPLSRRLHSYLRSGQILTGGPNGCITAFDGVKREFLRDQRAYRATHEMASGHGAAVRTTAGRDGNGATGHWVVNGHGWAGGGVTSLRLHPRYHEQLLSGGGDGTVRQWDITLDADYSDRWVRLA